MHPLVARRGEKQAKYNPTVEMLEERLMLCADDLLPGGAPDIGWFPVVEAGPTTGDDGGAVAGDNPSLIVPAYSSLGFTGSSRTTFTG